MQKKILGLGLLLWLVALSPLQAAPAPAASFTSQGEWTWTDYARTTMAGARLSWGDDKPTSLTFNGGTQSIATDAVQIVSLGALEMVNTSLVSERINYASTIKGTLTLALNFSLPEGSQAFSLDLPFVYKNTGTNNGRNKNDSLTLGDVAPFAFKLKGVDYTLTILGFDDGDEGFSKKFTIAEGSTETQPIYAELTRVGAPAVPIPPTAILMGSGLLGLLGLRRRA